MKDVGWGDFLIALIVAPILVLPVVGAIYLLLFVALDLSSGSYSYWLQVSIIVTCVAEGLFVASRYEGPGSPIEHVWAWFACVAAIALVTGGLYVGRYVSAESAYAYAMALFNYVAWAFIIAMLSVFFNTRRKRVDPIDARRAELDRSAGIWMLKR